MRIKIISQLFLCVALLAAVSCSTAKTTEETVVITNQNTAAATPTPAPTVENQTAKVAPDALVKDLYKQHDDGNSPFFQKENRALVDKYFAKNLADTIWTEANEDRDGTGALEADPLYFAQDTDLKNFVVNAPEINGDAAKVVVTFLNFKEKERFVYSLVKENGAWKISDIDYGKDSLVKVYRQYNQAQTGTANAAGEFDGAYQIGDTKCTVKPIKMAFEVRWEKGTGTEIFFAQDRGDGGKYIFASNPLEGKPNKFAFDDENYNAGTFYRADGKEFAIKRIK